MREFTSEQKEKVWTEAADAVKASYDQLLGRWKEDMDTLLVYVSCESKWKSSGETATHLYLSYRPVFHQPC